ncbi:MAG TPA: MFS transporter [Solirubrobacteraceae bacterium]
MSSADVATSSPRRAMTALGQRLEQELGGATRMRVVIILACTLALSGADLSTIGASAPQLSSDFHISGSGLGLLASISLFVGAAVTVPAGALADRMSRSRLLGIAVALWAAAMVAGALAQSYDWLLFSRLGLGAVTAAVGPAIASLTGDFFPARERARMYGYIISGELIGSGVGFALAGIVSGVASWRWAFAILALLAAVLALTIVRKLPEPTRGTQARLDPRETQGQLRETVRDAILATDVSAVPEHVLHEDPMRMPLRRAVAYVLSIGSNRLLIAASAIGYFFLAGVQTFGLVFVRGHFHLSQAPTVAVLFVIGLGAIAGVLVGGRLADKLISRGQLDARIVVGAFGFFGAAVALVGGLLVPVLVIALPLLILAAASLAAPNPPLDAARLDIMPSRLWGRAEGVRTLLRQTAQGAAPLLFGLVADAFSGAHVLVTTHETISARATQGLEYALLIMLCFLFFNGILLLIARRRYPADVVTAVESEQACRPRRRPSPEPGLTC